MKDNKYFLPSLTIFLIVIYILSFIMERKNNRIPFIKSSFITSNIELLDSIEMNDAGKKISFKKKNDLWFAENEEGQFPIEQKQFESFIMILKNIRNMYKYSYTNDNKFIHLFNSSTLFKIDFLFSDNSFSSLDFGSKDFSGTGILFKHDNDEKKYFKTSDEITNFFNVSSSFWCDPYVVPHSIFASDYSEKISSVRFSTGDASGIIHKENNLDSFTKILSLRHGLFYNGKFESLKKTGILRIDSDYYDSIEILIFELPGEGKVLKYNHSDDFDYAVCISDWTYDNLLSLFKN